MLASIPIAVTMKASDAVNQHMNKKDPKIPTEKHSPKPRLYNIVERIAVEHKRLKKKDFRDVYNKGYYTDNIMSDSLHQDSDDEVNTDEIDSSSQNRVSKPKPKNTNKWKPNNSLKGYNSQNPDDWSDKAQDNFLETTREQLAKELSNTKTKWRLFSKDYKRKKHTNMLKNVKNR